MQDYFKKTLNLKRSSIFVNFNMQCLSSKWYSVVSIQVALIMQTKSRLFKTLVNLAFIDFIKSYIKYLIEQVCIIVSF
jgi:hypothetical protein